jgi:hypothetical protein
MTATLRSRTGLPSVAGRIHRSNNMWAMLLSVLLVGTRMFIKKCYIKNKIKYSEKRVGLWFLTLLSLFLRLFSSFPSFCFHWIFLFLFFASPSTTFFLSSNESISCCEIKINRIYFARTSFFLLFLALLLLLSILYIYDINIHCT